MPHTSVLPYDHRYSNKHGFHECLINRCRTMDWKMMMSRGPVFHKTKLIVSVWLCQCDYISVIVSMWLYQCDCITVFGSSIQEVYRAMQQKPPYVSYRCASINQTCWSPEKLPGCKESGLSQHCTSRVPSPKMCPAYQDTSVYQRTGNYWILLH